MLGDIWQDLRYAIRSLGKNPGFAVIAVLTLIGVAIGLLAASGLTRLMKSVLFGVSAADPLTYAGIAALLTCVAMLACYIPARRATRVDPMAALRCE